ncbi:MAG: response regulator [Deltaproteobacteria bacterium]|nr:response regulator [Deltaproteobacteria bacterium]
MKTPDIESTSPTKRILVVDDEEGIRITLKACLEGSGYEVLLATSGRVAQQMLGCEKVDAVISDVKMPDMNGIELTHFIKRHLPEVTIILMTGFSEYIDAQEAYDIGADEFISKPFKKDELLEILNICLKSTVLKEIPPTVFAEQYCKLSIDDFTSGRTIPSDMYIRLSAEKYVKIAHAGEALPADRIASYKAKNIRHFYMLKEDFCKYVGFTLTIARALKTSSKISRVKKLAFLKHTTEIILEQVYLSGIDEDSFMNARSVVETTTDLLSADADAVGLLRMLDSHADFLYAHSLGVSMYGTMIAKQLHWTSPPTIFKVAVGGLMHDIEKKEIDRLILEKARKDLSHDELKLLESHPTRGLEILGEIRSIPSDVLQIAMQHHENCMGQGYPAGLKRQHIHPLARVIAVANEFCGHALRSPSNHTVMAPIEAINRMINLHSELLDAGIMAALLMLFKIDLPEHLAEAYRKLSPSAP